MIRRRSLLLLLAAAGLTACKDSGPSSRTRGIVLLVDTSGTYARQMAKVKQIVGAILNQLQPQDSVSVIRINTGSYTEKNVVASITLAQSEGIANQEKIDFKGKVSKFLDSVEPAPYTDITGGLLEAIEYLNEKEPAHKEILIFSDMKEELRPEYIRKDVPLDLKAVDVVALNVTKLRADNLDPRTYMARLADWKTRVEKGGGHFRVVNDVDHLEGFL
jgi:hypothetical protein